MKPINKVINRFFRQESGATSVEYAVMIGLVIVACIAGIQSVGAETLGTWFSNSEEISNAMNNNI